MILNIAKKKFLKTCLSYCPKLYGTGLEPGTFEFVTYLPNNRANYTIDYLWILKFLFWIYILSALNVHYFPRFSCT